MHAFKSLSTYILLHGSFFFVAMFVILWVFEQRRDLKALAVMAVSAVAPFFLISFASLGVWLLLDIRGAYPAIASGSWLKLGIALPVLWFFFRVEPKRAALYTGLWLAVSLLSPMFVRAFLQLFDGRPGPMMFLLTVSTLLVVSWVATRRIENPIKRMFARCFLIAALIAPTPVIGHGSAIILPAAMVWPMLFQGGGGALALLASATISSFVTAALLAVPYYGIGRLRSAGHPGRSGGS